MEKVSIIVPIYKVEAYLQRCVDSLMGQTYPTLEIILVDDGSPDGSGILCDTLAEKDDRIVVIHQENQGVSAARNRGLDVMTGDWVCFCDGDDWYELDFVEKMLKCAKEENADYVICNYQIVSDGSKPIPSSGANGLESGCEPRMVIACGPTSSCTHMIHRELFDNCAAWYPAGLRQYEELPVIPVLAKSAKNIGVVREALYNYYQRGNGTSASNCGTDSEANFFKAWHLMAERLGEGYEQEVEYHAIYALLYGEVLQLCKNGVSTADIKAKISGYRKIFPKFKENVYRVNLGTARRLFVFMADKFFIKGLRLLAWIHSKIVS